MDGIAAALRERALPRTLHALTGGPAVEGQPLAIQDNLPHDLMPGQDARTLCQMTAFHNSGGGIVVPGMAAGARQPPFNLELALAG